MKNTRTLTIVIASIVALAAAVGFFVTFHSSPHSAFARTFIDVGMLIALVSVVMTAHKPPVLRTGELVGALRDLMRGRYQRRISDVDDFAELKEVAQAVNELATKLLQEQEKAQEQSAENRRPVLNPSHSFHPELGPVRSIKVDPPSEQAPILAKETPALPAELMPTQTSETIQTTHTVQTVEQPAVTPAAVPTPTPAPMPTPVAMAEEEPLTIPTPVMPEVAPAPEPVPASEAPIAAAPSLLEEFKFNIRELFDQYIEAQRKVGQMPIEFGMFEQTINQTVDNLREAHQCRGVRFSIVIENSEVALRPKLVR